MQVVHAMPMNREISSGRGHVRAAGPGARSIAAMKRAEAQLHSERARIGEDLEEAQERLAAEVAAQVRSAARLGQGPRYKRYRDASSGVRGMQTQHWQVWLARERPCACLKGRPWRLHVCWCSGAPRVYRGQGSQVALSGTCCVRAPHGGMHRFGGAKVGPSRRKRGRSAWMARCARARRCAWSSTRCARTWRRRRATRRACAAPPRPSGRPCRPRCLGEQLCGLGGCVKSAAFRRRCQPRGSCD